MQANPKPEIHPFLRGSDHRRPQLLVSVRDASEAALAVSLGVDWIDLKNPDAGSLGPATEAVAEAVGRELSSFPKRSAAIGELRDNPTATSLSLAAFFPILKVGLSGLGSNSAWREELTQLSQTLRVRHTQTVPVIYADYLICDAPTPDDVLEAACQLDCRFMLIDTYTKDGRRLFDWLTLKDIERLSLAARTAGIQVVVAGSLALIDLPKLCSLPVAAIAIRGAVCAGDRRSRLCGKKIIQWVELMRDR